jgi:FKBP-type peptidyl-prolyl cis-trans isomerase 2
LAASYGCGLFSGKPDKVRKGTVARVIYTLEADGRRVETVGAGEPVELLVGKGRLIAGLEEALLGMKPGEEKTVRVPPEKGYGQPDPQAVQSVPLARFGAESARLHPGMRVEGLRRGQFVSAQVLSMGKDTAVLDFNHPYAGKTLVFNIRVVSVEKGFSKKKG